MAQSHLPGARPENCDCCIDWEPDALPCWPCYRAGYDKPNPDPELEDVDELEDGRTEASA